MTHTFPFFFGAAQHLFAWYHPAAKQAARTCAIVLCPPLGHEYVCSHRAFRLLAEWLAAGGFHVLRFDYHGTGNSRGGPMDPNLWQAWVRSLSLAANELRARSGATELTFVGLRMGGTLAATVAAERGDVDTLVLWDQCTTGKSYVRQVKVLGRMTHGPERAQGPDGVIEAAGFPITPETANTLNGIDLLRLSQRPAPRVLFMTRDDLPLDTTLSDHFQTLGTTVERMRYAGYAAFMDSPVKSKLPHAALGGLVGWLAGAYPEPRTALPAPPPRSAPRGASLLPMGEGVQCVREQPVRFGSGLFGMLIRPERRDTSRPGIILLNTGGDPHIGPHRMYVPLARHWASMGFSVLRLDLSGLGESPARPGTDEGQAYPAAAVDDIREAVRYMGLRCHTDRVMLVGMCSGGYYAIHAAYAGVPVTGIVAVNPPLYWTPGDSLDTDPYWNAIESARLRRSMMLPEKWGRLVRGDVDVRSAARQILGRFPAVGARLLNVVRGASQHASMSGIASLFPSHVDTRLIFSRGDPALLYFEERLGRGAAALLSRQNLSLQVVEGADHTFMAVADQQRLAGLLTEQILRGSRTQ